MKYPFHTESKPVVGVRFVTVDALYDRDIEPGLSLHEALMPTQIRLIADR